jgi:hypothetical protein
MNKNDNSKIFLKLLRNNDVIKKFIHKNSLTNES